MLGMSGQPKHSPADSSPVENRALLFSSEGGAAAASGIAEESLEQPSAASQEAFREPTGFPEPAQAAPLVDAAEADAPADGPPAASAVDVQMSEDPSPADRPGKGPLWLFPLQYPRAWQASFLLQACPAG